MKMNIEQSSKDYQRVEKALKYLTANYRDKPILNELASSVSLSEYHFQRIFTRWAGISPERFIRFLTKENAKKILFESKSLLEAAYKCELSSQGRLYDLFVSTEAVTPGEFKTYGEGLHIKYGIHPSPFGTCFIAQTARGICALDFIDAKKSGDAVSDFKLRWKNALILEDGHETGAAVRSIFDSKNRRDKSLKVLMRGTNFQLKVWEALLKIPPGFIVSYEDIAELLGKPKSTRAVANAVASNPVAYLIPCHRVIRKMGVVSDYRWGAERKMAILGWESSRSNGLSGNKNP